MTLSLKEIFYYNENDIPHVLSGGGPIVACLHQYSSIFWGKKELIHVPFYFNCLTKNQINLY